MGKDDYPSEKEISDSWWQHDQKEHHPEAVELVKSSRDARVATLMATEVNSHMQVIAQPSDVGSGAVLVNAADAVDPNAPVGDNTATSARSATPSADVAPLSPAVVIDRAAPWARKKDQARPVSSGGFEQLQREQTQQGRSAFETAEAAATAAAAAESAEVEAAAFLRPNPDIVRQLTSMGFGQHFCMRAALATGNNDIHAATEWIFEHMDSPGVNEPLDLLATDSGAASADVTADSQQATQQAVGDDDMAAAVAAAAQAEEDAELAAALQRGMDLDHDREIR